jgi:predicted metal-dependent phosphoesterase TrpH
MNMHVVESQPEYGLDLHFHTDASKDGRTTIDDVARFLDKRVLDVIGITDHDTIENALLLKEMFPDRIIPGIEVTTRDGEIAVLGVTELIPGGRSALDTTREAHAQGGIVLFQHPFHKNGLNEETARAVQAEDRIDLVEVNNGRDLFRRRFGRQALEFAKAFDIPTVSNGDTHGPPGVGRARTIVGRMPDVNDLDDVVAAIRHEQVRHARRFAGILALAQPEIARREKRRAAAVA